MDNPVADTRQRVIDVAQELLRQRGYSSVGLSEMLDAARVPKGSFYHWFRSKDALGVAVIENYVRNYVATIDEVSARPISGAERLETYWRQFFEMQSFNRCQGRCLIVKLGAEVSDLSDPMREALVSGTHDVVERIERLIISGLADESVHTDEQPRPLAESLYGSWIGASMLAKIHRDPQPLVLAMSTTTQRLGLSPERHRVVP